ARHTCALHPFPTRRSSDLEPSEVHSELAIADYSRAACELGIAPQRFLVEHNPMFAEGERLLAPFVTRLPRFDPTAAQVLLVNNRSEEHTSELQSLRHLVCR